MQPSLFRSQPLGEADEALAGFEPCVQRWFHATLGEPTPPQREAWPRIAAFEDVLITAPTGSGKTLAAFLACLDRLWRDALAGTLRPGTRILYVSPLKALSNDVQKNLLAPLAGIRAEAERLGITAPTIEVLVRTGDTPAAERQRMATRPPHILITTPESLYLCLTAGKSRAALVGVETVIIDEIHALVRDKRGSHLALSLERLAALCGKDPQRIGLSATQKPLEKVAEFLTSKPCHIVRAGHLRPWNLKIEAPDAELGAVASHEMWGQIYDRILALAATHRTILCFTNTRKLAERVAHDLGERLGADANGELLVAAHHGSMARELRLRAEERLKAGELRIMVATASLELGIDIGSIDLVCQLGSPRSIAVLLQRVGRAGHHKAAISKGILFAMTRDELCECAALLWAINKGDLDTLLIPDKPLDVLAQQIVAMCVNESWNEKDLRAVVQRASPYRGLTDAEFEEVLTMLCEGPAASRRGRALLHRDRVNGVVQGRKMARMVAQQNGGAIPDTFTYPVIAEPEGVNVGTLDEDFAIESSAGDIFLLGSTSWRIQRVIAGTVRVENAGAQPPTVPFWRGEAPARTAELSKQVGELRGVLIGDAAVRGGAAATLWLQHELQLEPVLAQALADYVLTAHKMLGAMPSHDTVVAERFFDEAGGMQLIIHAPFGGRINRAWGMALRKRFCRSFDFELQAAAGDDGVLLSLGAQHSFPLEEIFDFLSPNTVEDVLTQAVLQAPIFGTRFRWNATRALQLERYSGGQRVPPQLQRARSDDLLAAVFPAQVGCQDNHGGGDVELPDHPLVKETMRDCLTEAMDVAGLKDVLARLKDGRLKRVAIDLPEPSPFAHQHLNSAPYTFLDDAPLEERRARAVQMRRTQRPEDVTAFGALDGDAIRQVVADAAPLLRDAAEVHDALLQLVLLRFSAARDFPAEHVTALLEGGRAVRCGPFIAARERIPAVSALFPGEPLALAALLGDAEMDRDTAAVLAVRGHMDVCGPMRAAAMAERLGLAESVVMQAFITLETQGQLLRGRFSPEATGDDIEFCDRRLLQRIHRLTVGRLRAEIQPLSSQDFVRFALRWHQLDIPEALAPRGAAGIRLAIEKLEGWEAPAAAWEHALLEPRVRGYAGEHLDQLCLGGDIVWGRLPAVPENEPRIEPGPKRGAAVVASLAVKPVLMTAEAEALLRESVRETESTARTPTKVSSVTFARRSEMDWLLAATGAGDVALPSDVPANTQKIFELLSRRGASFAPELASLAKLDAAAVEEALWDLLCRGLVTADDVDNLRLMQSARRRREQKKLGRASRGRWGRAQALGSYARDEIAERAARLYLQRYGIVFRDLVMREPTAPRWREVLLAYRRMETRGEIRGGRFVAEVVGEQFALPDAVEMARAVRREKPSGRHIRVAAVDPLNLTTILTQPIRVPRVLGEWVTYVDGVAVAEGVGAASVVEHGL